MKKSGDRAPSRTLITLMLSLAGSCVGAGHTQRVRSQHADMFACDPSAVEVKALGFEAGRDRYYAQGCDHFVLYVCTSAGPCLAEREEFFRVRGLAQPRR